LIIVQHRLESDEAYSEWVERRKAEDGRNAEIADYEQARRWYEFQTDEREENGKKVSGKAEGSASTLQRPRKIRRPV
jgi:hypothetical protein